MSFSREVKEEISKHTSNARHCRIAELAAIVTLNGQICESPFEGFHLEIRTENEIAFSTCLSLLKKLMLPEPETETRKYSRLRQGVFVIKIMEKQAHELLKMLKMDMSFEKEGTLPAPKSMILADSCCKRSYLRGAYLTAGSMSDPEKTYHYEIAVTDKEKAIQLQETMQAFDVDAKVVTRKNNYVVYVKEGSQIVDLLSIMEAHVALMNLENARIVKEMRNSINRQVNCEAANISKTVTAAAKQIDDIKYIRDTIGFSELNAGLSEVAQLRLDYPEASLKELGMMLSSPIGKSGVNHRLTKLSEMAEGLRS